ncbi:hypothetical protein MANES_11G118500v8 [Manihot esculenta]|uniref:Uncharacterized protein n=1 Tax=Manihot esculenta TaxID=3983 RepID=A0A2C9V0N0_MANES|nr:hypothetical protein MANES_11G118500v8 [Manihot esculenta]
MDHFDRRNRHYGVIEVVDHILVIEMRQDQSGHGVNCLITLFDASLTIINGNNDDSKDDIQSWMIWGYCCLSYDVCTKCFSFL